MESKRSATRTTTQVPSIAYLAATSTTPGWRRTLPVLWTRDDQSLYLPGLLDALWVVLKDEDL